ncbi:transcriptional regulator [Enterobacter sp. Ag1]|uniref:transcriptional regulator n=1 Tax=Enterobacter sp. Ag1 TaxID=1202448 RepID=UPI0002729999|nr:transcriptional regulator [Enterobacter sp. Ag1]EJF30888.1 transcriptional regulator [Enterobacter sp. Ag1]
MKNDVMLIVLTENHWLYTGLAALLPEMDSLRIGFSSPYLPPEVRAAGRVIIAVDSRIVLRGEWSALNTLHALRPDAILVWLACEQSGRLCPFANQRYLCVSQRQDITSLRLALRQSGQYSQGKFARIKNINLTLTERHMLPFFLSGMSIHLVSRITGKPLKTLYAHRKKILEKTGMRQLAFLQFVNERNQGLPGIFGLEGVNK